MEENQNESQRTVVSEISPCGFARNHETDCRAAVQGVDGEPGRHVCRAAGTGRRDGRIHGRGALGEAGGHRLVLLHGHGQQERR